MKNPSTATKARDGRDIVASSSGEDISAPASDSVAMVVAIVIAMLVSQGWH
jgi:hypothetical protein